MSCSQQNVTTKTMAERTPFAGDAPANSFRVEPR